MISDETLMSAKQYDFDCRRSVLKASVNFGVGSILNMDSFPPLETWKPVCSCFFFYPMLLFFILLLSPKHWKWIHFKESSAYCREDVSIFLEGFFFKCVFHNWSEGMTRVRRRRTCLLVPYTFTGELGPACLTSPGQSWSLSLPACCLHYPFTYTI